MKKPGMLCLCVGLALTSAARAQITYQYVTDQTSYTPNASGNVTVSLFLQETVTGTSTSLLASVGGLFSGGIYVTKTGVNGTATISTINKNTAFGGNLSSQAAATQARLLEDVGTSPTGVMGTVVSPGVTQDLLGTIVLNAGTSATTFAVEPYKFAPTNFGGSGFDGNTLTNTNGFDVDVTSTNPAYTGADTFNGPTAFSFTVAAAVPEPSSMILSGLAGGLMIAGVGYRRHKAELLKGIAAA